MEQSDIKLVVCWWDKPPMPKRKNVYRVVGDITFANGKAIFEVEQTGSIATVDIGQLDRIFIVHVTE